MTYNKCHVAIYEVIQNTSHTGNFMLDRLLYLNLTQ